SKANAVIKALPARSSSEKRVLRSRGSVAAMAAPNSNAYHEKYIHNRNSGNAANAPYIERTEPRAMKNAKPTFSSSDRIAATNPPISASRQRTKRLGTK